MVKIKPILFNTEMVRATLENRKTATRRVVKPQHLRVLDSPYHREHPETPDKVLLEKLCEPPYRPGDILYVRETWGDYSECQPGGAGYYLYRADYPDGAEIDTSWDGVMYDLPRWRPSIHMPRDAARIFLRVTGVRVERLQEIDDAQAYAEGAEGVPCNCDGSEVFCSRCCNTGWFISPRSEFAHIWDSTIKPVDRALCGWRADPLVWVIEFERCEKPEERKMI